jgi:hypothetical protein
MDKLPLLREFFELSDSSKFLNDDDKKAIANGDVILSGLMQKADTPNGNGRIYPYEILRREVVNYKKLVKEKRAIGELDHPSTNIIELKNASHMVVDIDMDGKDVIGKIKILTTPSGQILRSLINDGVKLGISSRGLGSTRNSGSNIIVQEDFQLLCFDMVSDPSTIGAFMLAESKNNFFNRSDRIYRALNDILL